MYGSCQGQGDPVSSDQQVQDETVQPKKVEQGQVKLDVPAQPMQHEAVEPIQHEAVEPMQHEAVEPKHQADVKSSKTDQVDVLDSSSVRRKRMFVKVQYDEVPVSSEEKGGQKCCHESCRDGVNDLGGMAEEMKLQFVNASKLVTKNNLIQHLNGQKNVGMLTDQFNWKGKFYCSKAFSEMSGVSIYTVKEVLLSFARGRTGPYVHGNSGFSKFSEKVLCFKVWMKAFLDLYSQSAPDSEVQVLAHWVTKAAMYEMYKKETVGPHLALPTFYEYIKTYFGSRRLDKAEPQVRFSLYSSHSVCDQCVAFNASRQTCKSEADLTKVNQLKMSHMSLVSGARQRMEELKQHALRFPNDSLILQLDGMDNSKSYCPRMKEKSKKFAGLLRLPTKIQGCIIYSGHYEEKRKLIFYLNHDQFQQSSNMIVSILFKLLKIVVNDHGKLPKKLRVFADNCYRENKNR